MNELMTELLGLIKDMRAYYQKAAGVTPTSETSPTIGAPPRKTRTRKAKATPKTDVTTTAPLAAPPTNGSAAPNPAEMNEADSKAETDKLVSAFVQRFNKMQNGKPEGFHMAKKILADEFKVARLNDLVHTQRLQFMTRLKGLIAEADGSKAASTPGVGL